VTADLVENTCGAQADDFPQRFSFRLELAHRAGVLEWRPEGAAATQGVYDPGTGTFRVTQEVEMMVSPPDRRYDFAGCVVQRTDIIDGVAPPPPDAGSDAATDASADAATDAASLDAGILNLPRADGGTSDASTDASVDASTAPAQELVGSETVAYGAVAGSDCRGLIGAAPGQVLTLPCTVRYRFTGRRP